MAVTADVDAALTGGTYEVLRARLARRGQRARDAGRGAQRAAQGAVRRRPSCGSIGDRADPHRAQLRRRSTSSARRRPAARLQRVHRAEGRDEVADVFALHRFAATRAEASIPRRCRRRARRLPDRRELERDFANLYRYYRDARLSSSSSARPSCSRCSRPARPGSDIKVLRWRIEPDGTVGLRRRPRRPDHAGFPAGARLRVDRDHARRPGRRAAPALQPPRHAVRRDRRRRPHAQGREQHRDRRRASTASRSTSRTSRSTTRDLLRGVGKPGGLILLKSCRSARRPGATWSSTPGADGRPRRRHRPGLPRAARGPRHHLPRRLLPGQRRPQDLRRRRRRDCELERELRSPNGEDVLYVYSAATTARTCCSPYNLIRKEIATPIRCHGYSLFADGTMVVFRASRRADARAPDAGLADAVHVGGARGDAPTDGSYLGKVGNADLVRGISDALSIARLAGDRAADADDVRGPPRALRPRATDGTTGSATPRRAISRPRSRDARRPRSSSSTSSRRSRALEREAKRVARARPRRWSQSELRATRSPRASTASRSSSRR